MPGVLNKGLFECSILFLATQFSINIVFFSFNVIRCHFLLFLRNVRFLHKKDVIKFRFSKDFWLLSLI